MVALTNLNHRPSQLLQHLDGVCGGGGGVGVSEGFSLVSHNGFCSGMTPLCSQTSVISLCSLYNMWKCLQLLWSISLTTDICEESDNDTDDSDDGDDDVSDLEGAVPTTKRQRLAKEEALEWSPASRLLPTVYRVWGTVPASYLIQVKTMSLQSSTYFGQHLFVNW